MSAFLMSFTGSLPSSPGSHSSLVSPGCGGQGSPGASYRVTLMRRTGGVKSKVRPWKRKITGGWGWGGCLGDREVGGGGGTVSVPE